jgi:hypothetical protein
MGTWRSQSCRGPWWRELESRGMWQSKAVLCLETGAGAMGLPRSLVTGAATTKARGDFGATLCQKESEGR